MSSNVEIRHPKLSELPSLQKLFSNAVRTHFAYFPHSYQRRVISENGLRRLTMAYFNPRRAIYVAVVKGQVIGYIIGNLQPDRVAYIFWLFVDPGHRGGNLGLKLLSRLLRHMEQAGATKVMLGTYDHQAYYARQGFKEEYAEELEGVPITYMSFSWSGDEKVQG